MWKPKDLQIKQINKQAFRNGWKKLQEIESDTEHEGVTRHQIIFERMRALFKGEIISAVYDYAGLDCQVALTKYGKECRLEYKRYYGI